MFSFGDEVEETYNNPSGSIKRFLGLKGGCAANTELQSSCAKESLSVNQSRSRPDGKLASRSSLQKAESVLKAKGRGIGKTGQLWTSE